MKGEISNMRTRKPNVTKKDFGIIKGLRAGKASTHEISELTGFSDSTIWNIDKCQTFDDYVNRNIARRKDNIDKQLERAERPEVIENPHKADPEQLTVDSMLQGTDQERTECMFDVICEMGSTLAQIATTCTRMAVQLEALVVQLEALAGGKKQ